MITRKLINGAFKRIERIIYPSTGAVVERILPLNHDVPEEVIVIREPKVLRLDSHIPYEGIHNQEYLQYQQALMGL
jgi:nucleoside-diphosphate-sugar epimerase